MTPAAFNTAMGAAIRRLRKSNGLTMKAVSDQLGFSYQQQQKNETGVNACSGHLISKYAVIFGVTVSALYEEAGIKANTSTPSQAESAGFLAARYVSRIKDSHVRATVVDFARKLAYRGAEA